MQHTGRRRFAATAAALTAAGVAPVLAAGVAHAAAAHPTAAPRATTTTVVAVTGTNKALYASKNNGAFKDLGGALVGSPSVISWDNRNFYFGRGTNNNLYVRTDTTAFTAVHPSAPLVCASGVGASTDGGGNFLVGCIGTNGYLYSLAGELPSQSTLNPAGSTLVRHAEAGLNTDGSTIVGGAGGDPDFLTLYATGREYADTNDDNGDEGNVYAFDATTDSEDGETIGLLCAGSPVAVDAPDDDYLLCHDASTGAAKSDVLAYRADFTNDTISDDDLGPALLGSPTGVEIGTSDNVRVYITGTNGSVYSAMATSDDKQTAFARYTAGTSAAGPGAVVTDPTSSRTEAVAHRRSGFRR